MTVDGKFELQVIKNNSIYTLSDVFVHTQKGYLFIIFKNDKNYFFNIAGHLNIDFLH